MREAAIGILFSSDHKEVLLIKRRDVPVWVLPGGGIDRGETPEQAALREFREETGLDACIKRKVGTWLPVNRLGAPTHVFECAATISSKLVPQQESLEIRFWPIAALSKHTFFLHQEWIIQAQKQTTEPITTTMSSLTYSRCLKLILRHPLLSLRYLMSRFGYPINTRLQKRVK